MTHLCNCKPKSWRSSYFVAISQHYLPAHNERDNEELITHVARRPEGALGVVGCSLISARPRSRSMLVEVSGPCGTAKSDTLRPKRLPVHIGSAGERARPPVQSFFVPGQMNRTEPNTVPPLAKANTPSCRAVDLTTLTRRAGRTEFTMTVLAPSPLPLSTVNTSHVEAVRLYRLAAEQGYAAAQNKYLRSTTRCRWIRFIESNELQLRFARELEPIIIELKAKGIFK
jgi:hypothetical protein